MNNYPGRLRATKLVGQKVSSAIWRRFLDYICRLALGTAFLWLARMLQDGVDKQIWAFRLGVIFTSAAIPFLCLAWAPRGSQERGFGPQNAGGNWYRHWPFICVLQYEMLIFDFFSKNRAIGAITCILLLDFVGSLTCLVAFFRPRRPRHTQN